MPEYAHTKAGMGFLVASKTLLKQYLETQERVSRMQRVFLLICLFIPAALTAQDSFLLRPSADAFVAAGPDGSLSQNNYGGAGSIALAAPGLTKGEMQSVLQFDLSGVASSLNNQYGAGAWHVASVSFTLFGAPANNNPIFNSPAPGRVGISWMQNDSWTEGTGTPSAPGANGVTLASLQNSLIGPNDQSVSFDFDLLAAGAGRSVSFAMPGLFEDVERGDKVSLRLFAADDKASFTFYSGNFPGPGVVPQLFITAVPEPSPLALGVLGLAGIYACGCIRHGKRRGQRIFKAR